MAATAEEEEMIRVAKKMTVYVDAVDATCAYVTIDGLRIPRPALSAREAFDVTEWLRMLVMEGGPGATRVVEGLQAIAHAFSRRGQQARRRVGPGQGVTKR